MCAKILHVLHLPVSESALVGFGSWEEVVLLSSCPVDPPLLLACFKADWQTTPISAVKLLKDPGDIDASLFARGISVRPRLVLLKYPHETHRGRGRMLHREWIDHSLFRRWKRACNSRHNQSCCVSLAISRPRKVMPHLLIDIWRECLVPAEDDHTYVVLSYVWGETPFFRTVSANLPLLQQIHSFSAQSRTATIPRTIRDAMGVVNMLGERYLWVDSLCIVQDDKEEVRDQIKNMASIFANACVTIVAAQGIDAQSGLRGVRSVSHARDLPPRIFKFGHQSIVHRRWNPYAVTKWEQRGWTFQEDLFSACKIIFQNETVRWECTSATWHEDIEELRDAGGSSDWGTKHRKIFSVSWPDLARYGRLVESFAGRMFTFPEDVLAAFAGVTNTLTHTFAGGFLYDLPVLFFDVVLLWEPQRTIQRRFPTKSLDTCLPSWSWVGWYGSVDTARWGSGMEFLRYSPHSVGVLKVERIIPITQWYCGDHKNTSRRLVETTWQLYKNSALHGQECFIPGWRRFPYVEDLRKEQNDGYSYPSDEPPKYIYKHESDAQSEFWYPIPLCDPAEVPPIHPPNRLLFCRTQRGWLYLGEGTVRYQDPLIVSLFDEQCGWAGVLRLHEETHDPEASQMLAQQGGAKREPCELVAISRGYAYNDGDAEYGPEILDEWNLPERPKEGIKYEYYNVLQIEWQDQVAYRKALGRVRKDVWESSTLEWIDLTLG